MMKNKRLIAMRCTREQFETLGIELSCKDERDFIDYNYLHQEPDSTFFMYKRPGSGKYEIHETFNKDIFLKACGLVEKLQITKETAIKYNMKDEFPELFDVVPKKGEYWFHSTGELTLVIEFSVVHNGTVKCIHVKNSKNFACHGLCTMDRKATPQEVKTALINESVKRGFEGELSFIPTNGKEVVTRSSNYIGYIEKEDALLYCNYRIYEKGTWAQIIPTLTKKEAEEKFNIKILLLLLLLPFLSFAQGTIYSAKSINTGHTVKAYAVRSITKNDTTFKRIEKHNELPKNLVKSKIKEFPVYLLKEKEVYQSHLRKN